MTHAERRAYADNRCHHTHTSTVEYSAGKCYLVELRDVRGVFKTVYGHAMVEQGIKGQQHSGNQQTLKELGFQTGNYTHTYTHTHTHTLTL